MHIKNMIKVQFEQIKRVLNSVDIFFCKNNFVLKKSLFEKLKVYVIMRQPVSCALTGIIFFIVQ